jgi:RND family efflux transporter MFP subunit
MKLARAFFRRWVSDPRYASGWVLAVLLLVLAGIYATAPETVIRGASLVAPEFRVHEVELGSVTLELDSQGTARARDRLGLAFRAAGEVVEVSDNFANGAWVKQGETLVRLDPVPFELEVAQRRHDLAAARLHLEQVQANAKIARRNPSRNATDFALQVPQLKEAEARVDVAQAALRKAESDLARATMVAPFSGRLEQVQVTEGQSVTAGQPLGQLFSSDRMEVRLPVPDEWLDLLAVFGAGPGQALEVPVTLEGRFGGKERQWQGTITRRESGISRNQMSWLIAEVDADSGSVPLEPRVFLQARIQGRKLNDIAEIPRSAMISHNEVWLLDPSSRIHRREVTWIYRDDDSVYVSKGLQPGEQILREGNSHLLEGSQIRVLEKPPADNASSIVASAGGVD